MAKISINTLIHLLGQLEHHGVGYRLGAKAPSLHSEPGTFHNIDCSGFARWASFKASNGLFRMPDGSADQHEWCERQGFEKARYRDAGEEGHPNKLFIAFITPQSSPEGVGHVWFLTGDGAGHSVTLESHGGCGPDSRPWNYHTLIDQVGACYLLPSET